ncbi:signal peptidase II [Virgibacillus sp. YIM 98842]|jgi:signal peptidase II|uniref:signal peptidase II n=1 Tax=Virgibacillus sp. YIM 98842 TaxID=2663533 RepID=UPI0013DA33F6|nr:signal peptidase II [Virgibacillus sp. YIM 98842]
MHWYYLIALIIIGIDQWTKWIIVQNMELGERIPVIENFFYITSHRNSGAAWGILQGQMAFFYIVTVIVVIGIIFYMQKYAKNNRLLAVSLSLLLGGAIGNFIDRLLHQEVVDFLDFYIFGYNFPIFNVADSSLTIGVILVIIATIIEEKKGNTKK